MSDIHLHPPIIELSYKEEIENLINTKNSKIYEDIVPFQSFGNTNIGINDNEGIVTC